jgi:lipoprotein-releasing system ATP-binding protein
VSPSTDMDAPRPTLAAAHGRPAPAGAPEPVLRARDIVRSFPIRDRSLEILHGIDLELCPGELVALVGASGAGKSTLLHVLGLLDRPTRGSVEIDGVDAWNEPIATRARLRNRAIGFVFQFYHLLPELDALENALLPAMIAESAWSFRAKKAEYHARARSILERVGLGHRLEHRPGALSGGEKQRVALARALLLDPRILLADEPTGNLDRSNGEAVLELLFEEQRRRGLAMILVTHDERLAERCQRVLVMEDGRIRAEHAGRPG